MEPGHRLNQTHDESPCVNGPGAPGSDYTPTAGLAISARAPPPRPAPDRRAAAPIIRRPAVARAPARPAPPCCPLLVRSRAPRARARPAFVTSRRPLDRDRARGQTAVRRPDRGIGPGRRRRPPGAPHRGGTAGCAGLVDMHTPMAPRTARSTWPPAHDVSRWAAKAASIRCPCCAPRCARRRRRRCSSRDGRGDPSSAAGRCSVEQARFAAQVARTAATTSSRLPGPAAQFDALVDEGRKLGLPVIGRRARVGLPGALFRGQVMVAPGGSCPRSAQAGRASPRSRPTPAARRYVTQLASEAIVAVGRPRSGRESAHPLVPYLSP